MLIYRSNFSYDMLFTYDRGMICIGQKKFQKALELLYNVVTAPMHSVNAIALEAYKKYVLVTLIHSGQFSVSLPKCASTAAQRHLKTWSIPYTEVGNCYNEGKISELQAVVVAHSSDFEKDNNLGLVKQAVSSLYKRNILRLTQKYLTLSLQDIANMVQLANAKEAEMHVLQMIQDGQIHALINQKDGMVRFLEDPEQYKTSEMIEVMDSVIQRTIGLSKNLIAMDESLSCDPLYLGKVGRERQRYDFGEDFDTVPQKFSMTLCCSASSSDTLLAGGSPKEEDRQSKVSSKGDDSEDLKLWMDKKGLPPCKLMIRSINLYITLLLKGDVAFSVPNSLVVTLERVLGNETIAELLTTNKLSELACLALYLMYEKKQGKKSVWYPYIRELDRQRGRGQLDVESPLLWSEAELEYLTGSPTKKFLRGLRGSKENIRSLILSGLWLDLCFRCFGYYLRLQLSCFFVWNVENGVLTSSDLCCFAAIQSCVVHLQNVSLARRFALVPLGPPLLAYCSNCKALLTAVDGAVELVVDRAYKAGDPIVAWCGPQPNAKLLLNYGFVDEDNPYDRIIVEAALSTDDPQYQDKRLVAQRKGKLSQQVFQVRVGKEREAVQDMLPYLRLGYMSDPAETQSVISSQGPVCSMSPCMERAVLDQLADYFMRRLSRYPTTLKEDDALLADPSLNPRKRVATRLVRLEKKMLAACLVATVDFLNELPDTTISPCPALYAPSLK
uniref:COP9 signalosome complex subunit 3 n=1 Tax=Brassica oleracea var. oleracea TaxID=109376 RepID=A0A0D3AIZ2_BRAOL